MNVPQLIEDLIRIRADADNPMQGEPSRRYQQSRLEQARARVHAALNEQIRECLREMSDRISNSHS
jgi:hypothetical protein